MLNANALYSDEYQNLSFQTTNLGQNQKHVQTKKIIVTDKMDFLFRRSENFMGKRENAGYQHLFHFPCCFP